MFMEQITHVTKCNKNNDTDNKINLTIKEALRGGLKCSWIESVNRVKIEIYLKNNLMTPTAKQLSSDSQSYFRKIRNK